MSDHPLNQMKKLPLLLALAVCHLNSFAVADTNLYLPYLAVAACCAVIVLFATRPQRGLL